MLRAELLKPNNKIQAVLYRHVHFSILGCAFFNSEEMELDTLKAIFIKELIPYSYFNKPDNIIEKKS
ncbi:hypothetical protein BpHYR1_023163 [Brachionus plicatilis]|uniref:Uncharacterized protein n=1 Tax=Brachionus plicatilis TaxID=10195 RepID=A0A3M7QR13_BRAPC|nr:hypothetical protein BpHYR1_023163 [Brachionus plicatilis]